MTPLVLGRLPLAVSGAVAGWLLGGLGLLLAGGYRPLLAVPVAGAFAVLGAALAARGTVRLDGPAWAGAASLVIVAGFGLLAWHWSSGQLVLRRDPGTYALYADWLRSHGSLPIPGSAGALPAGAGLASPGFYADGGSLVPQFLAGTPLLLAAAGWLGGLPGILHANAVVGALGLLGVAGLAARVVGPRAAPFAALLAGACYPLLHQARAPSSEPLAMLLVTGGLCALMEHRLLGGALAGLATLARVDAPADVVALVPWVLLAAPLAGPGLLAGIAAGLGAGVVLSPPYLGSVARELLLIGALGVALGAVVLGLRRRLRPATLARLATPAAAAVAAASALLAIRPLLQTVHRSTDAAGLVGALQAAQGLSHEPTRTYDEHTLNWVAWWLGWPGVLVAVAGLALLARNRLRSGPARYDVAPFVLVVAGAALLVLWRPSITPDHPWADRRLVPVVLPGLAICAAWALARLPRRAALPVGALVLLGPLLAARPLLAAATEAGEPALVSAVCSAVRGAPAVLLTGPRAARELPQVVRGQCGVPAGVVEPAGLAAALRPGDVAVAEDPAPLKAAGLQPSLVASLITEEDARLLARRPDGTVPLRIEVWLATAP